MSLNNWEISVVVQYFKQHQYDLTTYRLSRPKELAQFGEENESALKSFNCYDLMYCLDKKFNFGSYTVQDYIKDNFGFEKIANEIADKLNEFLKESKEFKNDFSEMQEFLGEMYYSGKSFSWFVADIGHIIKRTSNKQLNDIKEMFLPNKEYILDGCKNIMCFDKYDMEMVEKAFELLELDNQTIKENL